MSFISEREVFAMPRFFVENVTGDNVVISGEDAVHIGRSLRMKFGDEITISSEGTDYFGIISKITESQVFCEIRYSAPSESEPDICVTLFQAVPKADKLEFIVQKAVELGVNKIVPVLTSRCVSRPDFKGFEKKRQRLQKIAESAAKQSGRGIIPEVSGIITVEQAAKELSQCDVPIVCYEKGGVSFSQTGLENGKTVGLFIGSEGGFEQKEVELCTEKGAVAVTLGKRILRCETAPLAALSIIMNLTGNM